MDNQGKTDKQIRGSEVAAGVAIVGIVWIIGYLIIFSQKKQIKAFYNTPLTINTYIRL